MLTLTTIQFNKDEIDTIATSFANQCDSECYSLRHNVQIGECDVEIYASIHTRTKNVWEDYELEVIDYADVISLDITLDGCEVEHNISCTELSELITSKIRYEH